MPGRIYEIRYPNRDFEIDASGQNPPPSVGDTFRRNGKLWRVSSRTDDPPPIVLHVEPADGLINGTSSGSEARE